MRDKRLQGKERDNNVEIVEIMKDEKYRFSMANINREKKPMQEEGPPGRRGMRKGRKGTRGEINATEIHKRLCLAAPPVKHLHRGSKTVTGWNLIKTNSCR